MTLFTALSADELILYGGATNFSKQYVPYYLNALTNQNMTVNTGEIYSTIYIANAAIEGLTASDRLTPSVKRQLLGETKFMRGFCYFYLVNLYGDVPLVLTTDYKINTNMSKSSKAMVYAQIITDLKEAQNLLSDKYLKGDAMTAYNPGAEERVRPTKWAATAMLARAYLYEGDWSNAEKEATTVIDHISLYKMTDLQNTFLKNNPEAIWQLQPVILGANTYDAYYFVLPSSGPSATGRNAFYLSPHLTDSFEANDLRKKEWVNSVTVSGVKYYYPFKYKVTDQNAELTEYTMVLRLSEQYLIRAEARIRNHNMEQGIADLNLIRKRATDQREGSGQLAQLSTSLSQDDALKAVLHERQVELFMEWGHRWLDLKRMGYVDEVMATVTKEKGGTWNTNWQLYPFSRLDLERDPNLIQNPGY